jgi:hypothetical protein
MGGRDALTLPGHDELRSVAQLVERRSPKP